MKLNIFRFVIPALLLCLSLTASAKTYLVSVGIADYSDYPQQPVNNLTLPVKDAETIVDIYTKNTKTDYALLTDKNATKSRILKSVSRIFDKAQPDDIVVFFFSGHGYPGGFCAADGRLNYNEVRKAMATSKCKNKMMFVDACHAGGMRVDTRGATKAVGAAKKANVMLFLSSRNTETSIENPSMENGFFTTYLQYGLKGGADANRDRVITAKELFNYVHKGVKELSSDRQHPVMWGNFKSTMPVMKW